MSTENNETMSRIPERFRDVATAACAVARADRRICGILVGGSVATDSADTWSDLDLVIVCTDDALTPTDVRAFAERLGSLLVAFTGEHVGEPRLLIALYGPTPLHVDLKFILLSDLGARVEDGLILWERNVALRRVLQRTTAAWPSTDPQWVEDRFWVWVHYVSAKIARGELLEAVEALTMVRSLALAPLISAGRTAKPTGVRRIETLAPMHAAALRQTVATASRDDCLRGLRATIDLYRSLRDTTLNTAPLRCRTEAEQAVLRNLVDITRRQPTSREEPLA